MSDEELQPQLVELSQGNSTDASQGDTRRQIMAQLRQEIECFGARIKAMPAKELSVAIKAFLSDICHLMNQQADQLQKDKSVDANNGESNSKDGRNALTDGDTNDDMSSNLICIQTSLTHVLYRLNKISEASVKMYEDVRQKVMLLLLELRQLELLGLACIRIQNSQKSE
ncbi:hypothetical protein V6N11_044098 [Hibiscus sabdariffa]|uniref:Uncharacterized protein n=1 Tax=Hibiscus sabdariffa TaxID=183260 RepID=A0ABR2REQ5_9ROSI